MKTTFGKTGLHATRIGLGMAAIGRPGYMTLGHADDLNRQYDPADMERHAHEVLNAAWNSGVRYIDTARSYGLGEKFLSRWLGARKINPKEIIVASKWGYTYTADWQVKAASHEVKDHSLPVLQRQWKQSAALLGSYLNIYQIHSTTLETGVLDDVGVLNELAKLKSRGVHIGLTLTGVEQAKTLAYAMTKRIDGVDLFNVVQATFNLLESSVGPALADAHAAGFAVVIKEGLANGRLTSRNTDPAFAQKLRILTQQAEKFGCGIDALSLAFCLAQPFVDVVLSGAATAAHLKSNLVAAELRLNLDTLSSLGGLAESPVQYWQTRKALEWN